MSDADDVDDLELLRQAALTSLLKKKAEVSTTNAVFYRPSTNSNLISIQPVVADVVSRGLENGENSCSTDSENEIIIAEGLSVSSSDCDEIVEEVVVSEDDDENNNAEKNPESSEGEDAVSVASKDSFDEILNSIEEEINGGTTAAKKTTSIAAKKTAEKRRKDEVVEQRRRPVRSPDRNYKARSRSSSYRSSPDSRGRRANYSYSNSRTTRNTSRSPLRRRRTRSRSINRVNHSSHRNEARRRSPLEVGRHRQPRQEKLLNDRRYRSRSPIKDRARSRDMQKRDNRERSPLHLQSKTQNTAKIRSRSTSRNRRADRSAKSSPVRNQTQTDNKDNRRVRQKDNKSPTPPKPESWHNLTAEQKDRLEKRKRKFEESQSQDSKSKMTVSSGKIVLKPKNEDNKKESRHEPIVFTRTIEDDLPDDEGQSDIRKERLERKMKLNSRLGIKVTEEEASSRKSHVHVHEEEEDDEDLSPSREVTGRLVESLESFETPSALEEQKQAAALDKEDLRSKLEQKRASGGGRLFSFALRDTFDGPKKERKSRRKVVSMK